jgi:hypothetical protein
MRFYAYATDPKRKLRRCIAAHAEDEGRGRFRDADAAIQAGQEEVTHQRQESAGVPQRQDAGLVTISQLQTPKGLGTVTALAKEGAICGPFLVQSSFGVFPGC